MERDEGLKKEIRRLEEAARRSEAWARKTERGKYATYNSGLRPDRGYVGHKAAKMMKRAKNIQSRQQEAIEKKSKLLSNLETTESLKISPLFYHSERLVLLKEATVCYGEKPVCEPVDLEVKRGDRICLTGANGSGKSSILKRILGSELDGSGICQIGSGLKISYLPQDASFLQGGFRDFARENELDESLFKAILRKLDFERTQFDKDLADMSAGQKKKVLLAKSLCEQAHLYIWDEPLNFIDLFSRIQIEELILAYQPTLLFVEHDQVFQENIATRTVEIKTSR